MDTLNAATELHAVRLQPHQSLKLHETVMVGRVQSGAIALFAVPLHQSQSSAATSRQYLFRIEPGEWLFSLPAMGSEQGLLALPIEATELQEWPLVVLQDRLQQGDSEWIAAINCWITRWGNLLSAEFPVPLDYYPISAAVPELTLKRGQRCQPIQEVVWVQIQQGNARWMGLEELTVNPASGCLPLGGGLWLETTGRLQITAINTHQIPDQQTFWDGLAWFQTVCLHSLAILHQQSIQVEQQRFQERQRLDQQVSQAAIAQLASVFHPQSQDGLQGEPLLVAAGAVGRAMGIDIRPPVRSEDLQRLKDPLEAIARASRVRTRRVALTDQWWRQDCGALLAYLKGDAGSDPVALLPVAPGRYELFNPVDLSRTPITPTVAANLAKDAYMFYRPLPPKTLTALDLIKFGMQGRTGDLLIAVIAGVATTLLGMLTPQATAILIDSAIPDANRSLLLQIGLGLLAAACGTGVFRLTQGVALMRIETLSESSTQAGVWDRLLQLGMPFFRAYNIGDLEARVSAISRIRSIVSGTTLTTLLSSLFTLLNLGLLIYYSPPLTLIAVTVAVITSLFTLASSLITLRVLYPLEALRGKIRGSTVQLISGITKLRVAAAEIRAFAHWSRQYTQQQKLLLRSELIENSLAVFNQSLPLLGTIVLFWSAATFLQPSTQLSIGRFLAFNVAFGSFVAGVTALSNSIISILEVVTLWKRAKPILTAKPEVDDTKADPGRLSGRVAVDHIVFRYGADGAITLDDVSLDANPGEFVAITGPSGSGKSTILRLLLGFEMPESGAVYYDGQDLAGLDVYAVRRQLGVVLQHSQVMSNSIFENISGGALITMEEAWWAAESAGFAADIAAMPMGMHTVVSEGGTNLSGGQKQRLLIARALSLKPKILLMDEATSALDNRTQSIVSESLERLRVTRLVVAHRLSTIRKADRIYVLQAGRIVQQGTFEELAQQEGLFARLIARQTI